MNTKDYYVYILSNKYNTTLYVGVTDSLMVRGYQHKNELNDGFTKRYNVKKLVYYEHTNDIYAAIAREKQLKGWRREKKDKLIDTMNKERVDLYEQF